MVDRLDEGLMSPDLGPLDYKTLYKAINDNGQFLHFFFLFRTINICNSIANTLNIRLLVRLFSGPMWKDDLR